MEMTHARSGFNALRSLIKITARYEDSRPLIMAMRDQNPSATANAADARAMMPMSMVAESRMTAPESKYAIREAAMYRTSQTRRDSTRNDIRGTSESEAIPAAREGVPTALVRLRSRRYPVPH